MYGCVILAGGFGKRLYPMTKGIPKPLAQVGGESVILRTVRYLEKIGIEHCAVTLMYEGEQIKALLGKSYGKMKISYFTETEPLGTAGGVLRAADCLEGEGVLILAGDCVFDLDIPSLIDFHKKNSAHFTVGTVFSEDPTEYGAVLAAPDGRVQRFVEKAPWQSAVTGNVNTGIYVMDKSVLSMIPEGRFYDFAKDLFPRLLAEDKRLFSKKLEGYWCDVGDLEALYRCNMDCLSGKIPMFTHNPPIPDSVSFISGVMGSSCYLGEKSSLFGCVLSDGTKIGKESVLKNCMTAKGACVPDGSYFENAVIYEDGKQVSISDGGMPFTFTDSGLTPNFSEISPDEYKKLGAALMKTAEGGKIGIAHDKSPEAATAAEYIASGAAGQNADSAILLGGSFEAQTAYCAYGMGLAMSVFVRSEEGRLRIKMYDRSTLPICFDMEKAIKKGYCDGEAPKEGRAYSSVRCGVCYTDGLLKSVYGSELSVYSLDGVKINLCEGASSTSLSSALTLLDAKVTQNLSETGGVTARISKDGFDLTVTENGKSYGRPALTAILARDCAERGVYELCTSFLRSPELLWADRRLRVENYSSNPRSARETVTRLSVRRNLWLVDASFLLMRLAAVMKLSGKTLSELSQESGGVFCRIRTVPCTVGKTFVMDNLLEQNCSDGVEGLIFKNEKGRAGICCDRTDSFRIISYSTSVEGAEELCGDVQRLIESISH